MVVHNVRFVLGSLGILALLTGCGVSETEPPPEPEGPAVQRVVDEPAAHTLLLDAADPGELALTASQQIFSRSPVVVLAEPVDGDGDGGDEGAAVREAQAAAAELLGAPALLAGGSVSAHGIADEVDRLGARVAVVVGTDVPTGDAEGSAGADAATGDGAAGQAASLAGVDVVAWEVSDVLPGDSSEGLTGDDARELRGAVDAALAGTPTGTDATPGEGAQLREVLALTDPQPGQEAAIATLRAAGAVDHAVPGGDIAGSPEVIDRIDAAQALSVVGVGPTFGDAEEFAWRVAAAERGDLLPTGNQYLLPARYVSVAGDRRDDPSDVVAEAAASAEAYADLGDGPVVPTVVVEVGATAGHPTEDGDWVAEEPVAELEPLVDAALAAGQYVLLDIGAGTAPLVEEVTAFEELLARPGVGVALHPENRRSDGTTPPGQVPVAEVADVITYIEGVVTNHGLPPAMVVVHQTRPESVVDRDQLGQAAATAAVEVVVTADRTGAMTATDWVWGRVTDDLPDGVHAGWSGPAQVPYQSPELVPTAPAPLLVAGS